MGSLNEILGEIAEARSQHDRTGELLRPVGTGNAAQKMAADLSRAGQQMAAIGGFNTWANLLSVQAAKACAMTGPLLRSELVELGALVAAFIENLDKVAKIEAEHG